MIDYNQLRIDLHNAYVEEGIPDANASALVDQHMDHLYSTIADKIFEDKVPMVRDSFYDPEAEWNVR